MHAKSKGGIATGCGADIQSEVDTANTIVSNVWSSSSLLSELEERWLTKHSHLSTVCLLYLET